MADNITVTPGLGATVACDDVGGILWQRVKLGIGTDGSATDVSTSNPMPVITVSKYIDVTLSLDTSVYADGDVLAETQVVADCFRVVDGIGILNSVMVIDEDDQGQPFDLVFLQANASLGTENGAPSISDVNARNVMGIVRVNASDYVDLGGVRTATLSGLSLGIKAVGGTDDMYVAAISRGTGTYSASGVRLRLHVISD